MGRRHESKEAREVFRASLGFDFIFTRLPDGTKNPVCIEINGEDSGIKGVQELDDTTVNTTAKLISKIRGSVSPELKKKHNIGKQLIESMDEGTFQASSPEVEQKIHNHIRRVIDSEPLFSHAFQNPTMLEAVAGNKRFQSTYIPVDNRAQMYDPKKYTNSKSDKWIIKPNTGRGGQGIRIVDTAELPGIFKEWREKSEGIDIDSFFTIQEFIVPEGADLAPENEKNHPASMRLLMDFVYLADGTIQKGYEMAYQRVSSYPSDGVRAVHKPDDVYVVNKSRGARSVPASPEETESGRQVAYQIIRNLGSAYQKGVLGIETKDSVFEEIYGENTQWTSADTDTQLRDGGEIEKG